jgi:FdhD protein
MTSTPLNDLLSPRHLRTEPVSTIALARKYPVETIVAGLDNHSNLRRDDAVAIEEPLEIRLELASEGGGGRAIAVTMRTPGNDPELAVGFLHGEGIIHTADDVLEVGPCGNDGNTVRVLLREGMTVETNRLERNFYTTSSCGLCGKASIEAAMRSVALARVPDDTLQIDPEVLLALPGFMRQAQATFDATGGLHASALFSAGGELRLLREDVGRHNALDKVIGASLLTGSLPLHDCVLILSGRASFELLQKSMAAQIPVVAAIGAPSTLAVDLANSCNITLVGFLRDGSFNVYTQGGRLRTSSSRQPK